MSLYGTSISFISIGCSCQSAHQIQKNQPILEELVGGGQQLEKHGTYFDYLITPVETTIQFIEEGIPALSSPRELIDDVGPYWPEHDLWFVHYFLNGEKKADFEIDQSASLGKVEHFRNTFNSFNENAVFVLSNTQSNIDQFCHKRSFNQNFGFTTDRLRRLAAALERRYGNHFLGLLVVENPLTTLNAAPVDKVYRVSIEPYDVKWKGNTEDWKRMFQSSLPDILAPLKIPVKTAS